MNKKQNWDLILKHASEIIGLYSDEDVLDGKRLLTIFLLAQKSLWRQRWCCRKKDDGPNRYWRRKMVLGLLIAGVILLTLLVMLGEKYPCYLGEPPD